MWSNTLKARTNTFNDEQVISNDHIHHIQTFTKAVADINRILGYNINHNNTFREKAAVAVDQSIYPELDIIHNNKPTGADAIDSRGNSREYKKIEIGPGYTKPYERTIRKDGNINKKLKGRNGFQLKNIGFMLSRFRNVHTQETFMSNYSITVSMFFSENALPSISYVIKSRPNLQKIVDFFNEQLYSTPHGTNKWSFNNVTIPISWIVTQLDLQNIDVIVMIDNNHYKISVEEHNNIFIGKDLTPSGFLL
jgi:hypothetical protein